MEVSPSKIFQKFTFGFWEPAMHLGTGSHTVDTAYLPFVIPSSKCACIIQ